MESPSAYRVTCSRSQAFASSVPITRPQSAITSWSAFDWAIRADSRAFRSDFRAFRFDSRVSMDFWSAALVSARDF